MAFLFVYHELFQKDAELFEKAEGVLPNFARALKKCPWKVENQSWRFSKTLWLIRKKVKKNFPVCSTVYDKFSARHIPIYIEVGVFGVWYNECSRKMVANLYHP